MRGLSNKASEFNGLYAEPFFFRNGNKSCVIVLQTVCADAMSFCRFIDDVWTPGSIMFKIILPTISLKSSELSAV